MRIKQTPDADSPEHSEPPLVERIPGVLEVVHPDIQSLPIVMASPHSGNIYPPEFLAATQLGPVSIRKSEDAFVDQIIANAPKHGVPTLRALFPRAYLDVNREPYELDPDMFDGPLPSFVNAISPRASVGLGTVPRVVGQNLPIYTTKLSFADIQDRIDRLYYPYHARLERLIQDTVDKFGCCVLLDCHSMPSPPQTILPELHEPDYVLGDAYGRACAPDISSTVSRVLSDCGYTVSRNRPYAGGFITRHYGRPSLGIHALQVEIARWLYMDETVLTPLPNIVKLRREIIDVINGLMEIPWLAKAAACPKAQAAD